MNPIYRWRYPLRTDIVNHSPGRVIDAARHAAVRDAANDGYRPGSLPHITTIETPGPWTTVQVEFEAVPTDTDGIDECTVCGQRPAWGPGARRCRVCFAEADRQTVLAEDEGGYACGQDRAGTRKGYQAHLKADETPCKPCRNAEADYRRARYQQKATA